MLNKKKEKKEQDLKKKQDLAGMKISSRHYHKLCDTMQRMKAE